MKQDEVIDKDEVLKMAKQAGAIPIHKNYSQRALVGNENIEAFAKLVAAAAASKEREACIAIAESKRHAPNFMLTSMPPQNGTAVDISNAIRARGQE